MVIFQEISAGQAALKANGANMKDKLESGHAKQDKLAAATVEVKTAQ